MLLVVFFTGCVLFALAYRFYGRFLEKEMDLNDNNPTPAHTLRDNVDYVPTSNMILFGHHFSAIAGAGPIVGPVIAALAFGWLPAVLWIVIGAILIGGVHDFTVMVASVRNKGRSIGQICKNFLSPPAYYMFLFFILFTLIYVIIVFLDITASTFVPPTGVVHVEGSEQVVLEARQGGVVATASMFYIGLAILFGLCIYKLKVPVGLGSLVFVPLVFGGLWLGNLFPCTADLVPQVFGSAKNFWALILMGYCLFAALLPVWILLQPRDYLASYLLYACLFGGAVGLIIYGFTGHAAPSYPMFTGFTNAKLGFIFPALFVTIACGAVSGFHSVVASGTSAKQLDKERGARLVGYGSMLVEGVLALLAVATVMIIAGKVPAGQTPVVTFGNGLGTFVQTLGIPETFAKTFAMMAVSTFLLTTLDACTRLARFILEEIFKVGNKFLPRLLSTVAVLVLPALVAFQQIPGADGKLIPAWQAIWPVFGACNQLLAALALLVIFAWLKRSGKRAFYVAIPMVFMIVTTLTALVQLTYKNLLVEGKLLDIRHIIGAISLVLVILAVTIILDTIRSFVTGANKPQNSDGDAMKNAHGVAC
jgi:carbon starvation protein